MTPCTVTRHFVAAAMNPRCYIELAGKLYYFLKFCISCADANWQVVVITTPVYCQGRLPTRSPLSLVKSLLSNKSSIIVKTGIVVR